MINSEHALALDGLIEALETQWSRIPAQERDGIILVDLSHDFIEYVLYALLIAKNIQIARGARLIGYFAETSVVTKSCPNLNFERNARLAHAFGVTDIRIFRKDDIRIGFGEALSQVNPIITEFLSSGDAIFDWRKPWATAHPDIIAGTYESALRGELLPTCDAMCPELLDSLIEMNRVHSFFEGIFREHTVEAVVTGHLDYNPWRVVSHLAARASIPIYHFFVGRTLSVWKLNPQAGESLGAAKARVNAAEFRACSTVSDGDWSYRNEDVISPIAEVSTTPYSNLRTDGRALARRWLRALTPWQDDKPIVMIFTHTFSDIPCSDRQVFRDHAEWLHETLLFAAKDPAKNWIVRAHPRDRAFDRIGFIDRLETEFASQGNIQFSRGDYPMTTALNLSDAVVTVRGSVGIEAVAAGIPCILAGAAPYSQVGFSNVPMSADDYFASLATPAFEPVPEERQRLARDYIRFEVTYGDVQSEALPPVSSSYPDERGYLEEAARKIRRYSMDRDPFSDAMDSLIVAPEGRAIWPIRTERSIRFMDRVHQDTLSFHYGRGRSGQRTKLYGFHDCEPTSTWSSHTRSALLIPVSREKVDRVTITGRKLHHEQNVFLRCNDGRLSLIDFDQNDIRPIDVEVARCLDGEGDTCLLEFETSHLATPVSLGINGDDRALGFCIQTIEIARAQR